MSLNKQIATEKGMAIFDLYVKSNLKGIASTKDLWMSSEKRNSTGYGDYVVFEFKNMKSGHSAYIEAKIGSMATIHKYLRLNPGKIRHDFSGRTPLIIGIEPDKEKLVCKNDGEISSASWKETNSPVNKSIANFIDSNT